jgi:hypothetical protein
MPEVITVGYFVSKQEDGVHLSRKDSDFVAKALRHMLKSQSWEVLEGDPVSGPPIVNVFKRRVKVGGLGKGLPLERLQS